MSSEPIQRVLVAHNRYQHRGGEDAVAAEEVALLRSRGIEVLVYERENIDLEGMPRSSAVVQTFWSRRTTHEIEALIDSFRPQIVHVHNTFPLISPSIYWAARRRKVPVIQTLHNFRLVCPQALMLRDGAPCESCVGRLPLPAVVHRCYRGSRLQTGALVAMVTLHRALGTWNNCIDRYIALNDFCRDRFIAGGLPAEKIAVKANSVKVPEVAEGPRSNFLCVGRLSPEKGVSVVAEAMGHAAMRSTVLIVGTGPSQPVLEGVKGIHLAGALAPSAVYDEMRRASALLLPSIWYENFPRTLVEAFACGLPVIASRLGAMQSLIRDGVDGLLFPPGDAKALADLLAWAENHPEELRRMGLNARKRYEEDWAPEKNVSQLLDIYEAARREVISWQPSRPHT